jgi:hypothetical protein
VPTEDRDPTLVAWRLGPELQLWDLPRTRIATIWRPPEHNHWCRAEWPHDPTSDAPVAPLDLSVGHTLELAAQDAALVGYACVIAVQPDAVIAYLAADFGHVEHAGRLVVARWQEAQLHRARDQFLI